MKFAVPMIFTLGCLFTCSQALAAKVYKWVDSKGVVHYSAQPPATGRSEVIKPQTGHSEPVEYTAPTQPGEKKEALSTQTGPQKDPERCESARKNEETLRSYTHIKIKGEDGEYRFLSPEEQQQKLDEANKAIDESCD